jgi:hypothetical protein
MLATDGGCPSKFVREKRKCPPDGVDLVAINAASFFHAVIAEPGVSGSSSENRKPYLDCSYVSPPVLNSATKLFIIILIIIT